MKRLLFLSFSVWGFAIAFDSWSLTSYQQCVLNLVESHKTYNSEQIHERCLAKDMQRADEKALGPITERILAERRTQWNRFVITPHKRNYFLPFTHTKRVNREAYEQTGDWAEAMKHYEAKFQFSLKIPLNQADLFRENDGLYLGLTMQSWWQVYANSISAPFRETNYQPELFYLTGLNWYPGGGNTGLALGIEHQSNGRSQELSRSWNRVYAIFLWEKDDLAVSIRPWYRLPEEKKENPEDTDGDDNPDIEHYMGHFEFVAAYRMNNHELSFMGRNNLRSDNKGATQLGWSFPLHGHLKGFVYYFNGYGESLIDYDVYQERFGIGLLLTDML